jgi:hypothetical protein
MTHIIRQAQIPQRITCRRKCCERAIIESN